MEDKTPQKILDALGNAKYISLAVGAPRRMLEAWLLADPAIPQASRPAGKACEEFWGKNNDHSSNYPKHVLRRCVLGPRGWAMGDAIDGWNPARARPHAPSLDAFMTELKALP